MAEFLQVFITAGDREEARRLARALVERRLAGCVQIVSPIESIYWWEDEIESAEECLCLIKTSRARYEALEAAIRELHSYDTPEILAMPVAEGNRDYLQWLRGEIGN
ncbi:MAG TPA: divalent-cation tolerance protein CutA [Candidatus Sulfomarinibacteraceae bacterium]|nr:divalent-cation tolerance protein CutA [Candidatus Sulfomarinibacteraceae bacterium]